MQRIILSHVNFLSHHYNVSTSCGHLRRREFQHNSLDRTITRISLFTIKCI